MLKSHTSAVQALSGAYMTMAAAGKAPGLRPHLRLGTDLSAQLAGSTMGGSS